MTKARIDEWLTDQIPTIWPTQPIPGPSEGYQEPATYPPPIVTTYQRQPLSAHTTQFSNPQVTRGTDWPTLPTSHQPVNLQYPPLPWPYTTTTTQPPPLGPPTNSHWATVEPARRKQLPYPPFDDSKDPDAHVRVFITAARANRETDFCGLN